MAGDAFSLPSLVESVLVTLAGDNYATDTFSRYNKLATSMARKRFLRLTFKALSIYSK